MVTHSSTSRPVQCLCMAERTGCPVLTDLWSYVLLLPRLNIIKTPTLVCRQWQRFGEGRSSDVNLSCPPSSLPYRFVCELSPRRSTQPGSFNNRLRLMS
jgi:hypothetical protein